MRRPPVRGSEPLAPLPEERLRGIERILLIRFRGLGDVVLALPAARALRRRFPGARVAMLVDEAWTAVLAGHPDVDEAIAAPRVRGEPLPARVRSDLRLGRALRRRRFDLAVDLFGNPRSAWLTLLSGAPLRVGYDARVRRWAYHVRQPRHVRRGEDGGPRYAAEVNLDMVATLGAALDDPRPRIPVTEEARRAAREALAAWGARGGERLVGLSPAGGWQAKTWPAARFARLADLLSAEPGTRVLLLWGPGERPLVERVRAAMARGERAILPPPVPAGELAALLAELAIVAGNDSGVIHLAAAAGTPTVALFGPTDSRTWGTPGAEHVALQHEVPCGPCDLLACDDHRCLLSVTPERVAWTVGRLLRRLA